MITIDLDHLDGETGAIIIPAPTGVTYTNQVAGYSCRHPAVEGYVIPVRVPFANLQNLFIEADKGTPNPPPNEYHGWATNGITEEDANWLDALAMHKLSLLNYRVPVKVDRTRG